MEQSDSDSIFAGMIRKAQDGHTNWVQCDQCDQWRESDEFFSKDVLFLCSFLYPWEQEAGQYSGGCNKEPDVFEAFDLSYLEDDEKLDLSVDSVRARICHLLDKLPKNYGETNKRDLIDRLFNSSTDKALMHQVDLHTSDSTTEISACR